jgi:hypothetical protein
MLTGGLGLSSVSSPVQPASNEVDRTIVPNVEIDFVFAYDNMLVNFLLLILEPGSRERTR